jgi:hypothetical protein
VPHEHFIAGVLCVLLPVTTVASEAGHKVAYDGGSIAEKAGTCVYLYIESNQVRLVKDENVLATIPAASVTKSAMAKMFTAEWGPQ